MPASDIWPWAGTETAGSEPDVVMALRRRRADAGDAGRGRPAAKGAADLKIRVINVVDLMTLQPKDQHPHGISDRDFDGMFTRDRPVIFAYHGYPYLISPADL